MEPLPVAAMLAAALADGASLIWLLDEPSGTVATDSSGNGKTGTIGTGTAPTYHRPTIVTSLAFALGIADRLFSVATVFDTTALNDWSIGFWTKITSSGANALFAFGDTNVYNTSVKKGTVCYLNAASKLVSWVWTGAAETTATGTTTVTNGARHYIVVDVVCTGGSPALNIYLDGSLEATVSLSALTVERFASYLHVGYCANSTIDTIAFPNSGILIGDVEEVEVYPHALGATRVAAHWTIGQ